MSQNKVEWLVKNHVVLTTAVYWANEEFTAGILSVNDLVNQSDLPLVHTLWDFSNLEKYPTSLNEIRKTVQPLFTNERLGWVITVMDNAMIAFLSQAGSSMYGVRYRTFKTMDEAKAFLLQQDPLLQAL